MLFLLLVNIVAIHADSCNPNQRDDCGYVGVTQQECINKGCCWQPAEADGTPWCFYKSGPPPPPPPPGSAPFNSSDLATMRKYFLANININASGGVVASPDKNVNQGGSYYYHWMRDGALTMRVVHLLKGDISNSDDLVKGYAKWVIARQGESDPHGIDVRTEPKFELPSGQVYSGDWCRPQTDGPGLRASTLSMFALEQLKQGQSDFVKQYLWTGSGNGGAIKHDLDWVVDNYQNNGCDLWEEVQSTDFFWNRFNFRHGLLLGAEVATKMGDLATASKYQSVAKDIENGLSSHWNGNFIFETQDRPEDGGVICALNEGFAGDSVLPPTDSKVAATISAYNSLFHGAFPINTADDQRGLGGILYGRYKGDHYGGGNPWILITAALGELYYRGASYTLEHGLPDDEAMVHYRVILKLDDDARPTPVEFARMLASQGDDVLFRIRFHVEGNDFHLYEQLDKNTGVQISAYDLTWSYATVLKAMLRRDQFQLALSSF